MFGGALKGVKNVMSIGPALGIPGNLLMAKADD